MSVYDPKKDYSPFKYLNPTPDKPYSGFYAPTIHLVTNDVLVGNDECEFVFTHEQMNNMDRGTLVFRAKDTGGAIGIKKCSVSGLKMVIKLERRVVNFGKVQVEWATAPILYNS